MMMNFWEPFLPNVFERSWGRDTEADEEDVGLWVRERTKTVIVLLASSIEQPERIRFIPDPRGAPSSARDYHSETLLLGGVGKVELAPTNGKEFGTYMTVTA